MRLNHVNQWDKGGEVGMWDADKSEAEVVSLPGLGESAPIM